MKKITTLFMLLLLPCSLIASDQNQAAQTPARRSLAERLGFKATDKILIVNERAEMKK